MHDNEKMLLKKHINRAGKLTAYEFSEIKGHPELGFRILGSVSEFSGAATQKIGVGTARTSSQIRHW